MEFALEEMEELDDLLGNKEIDSFTLTRNCLEYLMSIQRAFVSLPEDVSAALKDDFRGRLNEINSHRNTCALISGYNSNNIDTNSIRNKRIII
jgi:hypothetical protein